MIRLITATPGSGKTCLVVEWLIREVERGFYKEFYTNIEGLRICGVRPLPLDCDWRTLNADKDPNQPPKLVIIDECQYIDAFMKENRSANNKIGKDLSTHRHYGIDIWFITQSVKLLNDYVLENVGEHVHLYRPRKKKNVTVYWWSYVQKSLTKTAFKDADDMQVWRLNPAMFDYYKSTSQVTDGQARVSKKLVSSLITFAFIVIILFFFVSQGLDFYAKAGVPEVTGIDEAVNAVVSETTVNNEQTDLSGQFDESDLYLEDDLEVQDRVSEIDNQSKDDKKKDEQVKFTNTDLENYPSYNPAPYVPSVPYVPTIPDSYSVNYVSSFDNKPAIVIYNHDTGECLSKNRAYQDLNLEPDKCLEHLQIVNNQ